MEIRKVSKCLTYFINQKFQNLCSFRTLHIMTESTDKGCTVSRHIDFRNQQHVMLLAESYQFLRLLNGIILTLKTSHVYAIIQHRENLAFQTPSLILCQMPMKNINFITGKNFDFLLQLIYRQITASDIVHETTNLECRPVHDFTSLETAFLIFQLTKSLQCPIYAFFSSCFHLDSFTRDDQSIGFFLIHLGSFYSLNHTY